MKISNIIIIVIALVGVVFASWYAYKLGYQKGVAENAKDVQFNLPGVR